jgi:hypothetical protein
MRKINAASLNKSPPSELSVIDPTTLKRVWIARITMCNASPCEA